MAHPTRFKRDAHLQGCAAGAYSTCHAGLLASVARGFHGAAHSGEVPPETRHHTQVAVVFVECSSRTLPKSWQLCRKCSKPPPGQTKPWRKGKGKGNQGTGKLRIPTEKEKRTGKRQF